MNLVFAAVRDGLILNTVVDEILVVVVIIIIISFSSFGSYS